VLIVVLTDTRSLEAFEYSLSYKCHVIRVSKVTQASQHPND